MNVPAALLRYRVMAYLVGVGLALLVFVGVPLQVWAHSQFVVRYVGVAHGILYMVYLVTVLDLVWRARLPLWMMVAMVSAGFVPIMAFVAERVITRRVQERLALLGVDDGASARPAILPRRRS